MVAFIRASNSCVYYSTWGVEQWHSWPEQVAAEMRAERRKREALERVQARATLALLAEAFRGLAAHFEAKRAAYDESVAHRPLELR